MRRPRPHDRLAGAAALGLLLLAAGAGGAEPLLTGVAYVDGAATYALFDPAGGGGSNYSGSLHAGMALPAGARVEVARDARVMLSPIPAIRYLLHPGVQAVNESFGLHFAVAGGQAFAYRLNLLVGTLVGDVAGPLRAVDNAIGTPRGTVSVSNGHFLIAVRQDGTTKYAVLRGTLTVSVPGDKDYHLNPNQVLTLLSERAKLDLLNQMAGEGDAVSPEQRNLGQAGTNGVIFGSLADDPEAAALLNEPFPEATDDLFAHRPEKPVLDLLPGQLSLDYNPEDLFQELPDFLPNQPNGNNTQTVPPVSPIFP